MVLQNYQNLIEITSNMIVSLGVGLKCPRKIHLNTQCLPTPPPPPIPTALYGRNALVERLLFLPKGSSSPFPPFTPLFLLPFVKCQENYPENLCKNSFAKFAAFKISSATLNICNLFYFMTSEASVRTCFHVTNFVGEEKFSWLPSKNKVADINLHFQRHTNVLVKLQCSVLEL